MQKPPPRPRCLTYSFTASRHNSIPHSLILTRTSQSKLVASIQTRPLFLSVDDNTWRLWIANLIPWVNVRPSRNPSSPTQPLRNRAWRSHRLVEMHEPEQVLLTSVASHEAQPERPLIVRQLAQRHGCNGIA